MRCAERERRRALSFVALAGLLPRLGVASPATLTLATAAHPPLASTPERPGFAEELVREALRRIEHRLQVVPLPAERALIHANAGIEDGDMYRTSGFEQEYPNLVRVPESLGTQDFVAFSLSNAIRVQQWNDLAPHSVAYVTGHKIVERRLQQFAGAQSVRDNAALFGLLANQRAEVVLTNRWGGYAAARSAGLQVRVHEPPLLRVPMYVYLHRRHETLVPRLSAAIAEVHRDGTWQRLYDTLIRPLEPTK